MLERCKPLSASSEPGRSCGARYVVGMPFIGLAAGLGSAHVGSLAFLQIGV
jgi:hypothetical protein